ncbi:MAG: glycoside hydrolase family 5 protein, partial [Clostridiales bacterium]|nr:glycoside hydrolase family 5 protein [Clostridiales bacterium]
STAVVTEMPVDKYGQLSVAGINIVSENGEIVQLKGISSYGLGECVDGIFNEETIKTLAEDWGVQVLRIAVNTTSEDGKDYISDSDTYFNLACQITDLCIEQGIYVIIDWHITSDGDPNEYKEAAVDFFSRYSALYGEQPNILYEICNEPNGTLFDDEDEKVDWDDCIVPYAEDLIDVIRENDPDNIIIVGTPSFCRDVDTASDDPIDEDNIAYSFHFSAGTDGEKQLGYLQEAIDNEVCVFVTEWNTTDATGTSYLYLDEAKEWLAYLDENNISWCCRAIGSPATQYSNALLYTSLLLTDEEKMAGHWPDEFISRSGKFIICMLLGQEFTE